MRRLILVAFLSLSIFLIGCRASADVVQLDSVTTVAETHEEIESSGEKTEDSELLKEVDVDHREADVEESNDISDTTEMADTTDSNQTDDQPSTDLEETSDTTETNSGKISVENRSYTITSSGTYTLTGTAENGQIIVDCADSGEVELILSDLNLSCDYSAPVYIKNADEVIITIVGENNTLAVTGDLSANVDGVDGVIFSKSDLTFEGSGTLTIQTSYTHGILGKDDIDFVSGAYRITAAKDGIQANDSVSIYNCDMTISAGNDGIQVENDENTDKGFVYLEKSNLAILSGEDGINASNYVYVISGDYWIDAALDGISADFYVCIMDGTFDITTGGGYQQVLNIITVGEGSGNTVSETDKLSYSMKAIKSHDILVDGGTFKISSYEDGFNANGNIEINGGTHSIYSGDEAFTAHGSLTINSGTIRIENGYEGLEGAYVTINGGNIFINVLDDGINGGEDYSVVTITGGNLTVVCKGDGLDSNGDMVISGGYIVLDVSAIYTGGDGNVDVTGTLTYTGGTIVDGNGGTIDPTQVMHGKPGGRGRRP